MLKIDVKMSKINISKCTYGLFGFKYRVGRLFDGQVTKDINIYKILYNVNANVYIVSFVIF